MTRHACTHSVAEKESVVLEFCPLFQQIKSQRERLRQYDAVLLKVSNGELERGQVREELKKIRRSKRDPFGWIPSKRFNSRGERS